MELAPLNVTGTIPQIVVLRAIADLGDVTVRRVLAAGIAADVPAIMELMPAAAADTTVVVVTPGWGDGVQVAKAGVMEIPDLVVVTKADLGALARRAGRPAATSASRMPSAQATSKRL